MISLDGNVAVVTGAASGLGRSLALALAKEGSHLTLADIDTAGLEETVSLIGKSDSNITTHRVDISDFGMVTDFAESVLANHGKVDWVINNAGVEITGLCSEVEVEDFEWLTRINYFGTVHVTKAFLPHLLENRSGGVVNVSSLLGFIGAPTLGAYAASKFAVRGFTESLRMELVGTGVRAICVHPGGIRTNLYSNGRYYSDYDGSRTKEESVKRLLDLCPLTPEKAASKILKGIKKGKERIVVGPDAAILERLQRWFPSSYPKILLFLHRFR